jgi:DMSO/TMAO reductase YedYZ molybdopterin-dependent catalytic subunit
MAAALLSSVTTVSGQTATVRIGDTGVPQPLTLSAADLAAMPRTRVTASAHHLEGTWEGVTIRELLTRAGVPEGEALRGRALSSAVVVTGADSYRIVFGIAGFDPAFTDRVAILADRKDDAPLPANVAPFQLVITGEKRPARWVRQVVSIEVTSIGQP